MNDLTKLLKDCEQGQPARRQVLQVLGLTATAAFSSAAFPTLLSAVGAGGQTAKGANKALVVTTVNHLAYTTPIYAKTRDFYVDLLGMRVAWDDGKKCQVDFGPEATLNSLYITQGAASAKPNNA